MHTRVVFDSVSPAYIYYYELVLCILASMHSRSTFLVVCILRERIIAMILIVLATRLE